MFAFMKNKWKEIVVTCTCIIAVVVTIVLYSISTSKHIFDESAAHKEKAENNIAVIFEESKRKIKKHNRIMNWIIASVVAAIYLTVSLITQKWEYTWIIWLIYCVYRIFVEYVLKYIKNK